MDLQKAIDDMSNKGESVEVTVGTPESNDAPAAGTENVGIGSMDSSVSASIDQAISNVGIAPESGATAETSAAVGAAAVEAPIVTENPAPAATETPSTEGAPAGTTPEVNSENKDVKLQVAEALLPVIDQASLDDNAKGEVYRTLWDSGNRDTKVIAGMIKGANPDMLSEMWKSL